MKKLILASSSPRRRELLQQLDLPFEVVIPRFEEIPTNLPPREESLFLAEKKARSIVDDHPNALILASDTLVVCEGTKLGKPSCEEDARHMLEKLSGKTHDIYTAIVLLNTGDQTMQTHVEVVSVTFRQISKQEILDYVASGEPLDKAGAYAIQGGAKDFATKVEGDIEAVIGLPLAPIKKMLT